MTIETHIKHEAPCDERVDDTVQVAERSQTSRRVIARLLVVLSMLGVVAGVLSLRKDRNSEHSRIAPVAGAATGILPKAKAREPARSTDSPLPNYEAPPSGLSESLLSQFPGDFGGVLVTRRVSDGRLILDVFFTGNETTNSSHCFGKG